MFKPSLFKYHEMYSDDHASVYEGYKEYVLSVIDKKRSVMIEYLSNKYDFDIIDDTLFRIKIDENLFSTKTEIYISVNIKETYDKPFNPQDWDIVSTLGLTEGVDYYKIPNPSTHLFTPDGGTYNVQCVTAVLNDAFDSRDEILQIINNCKTEGMRFVSYIDRMLVYDNNETVVAKCRYGKAPPGLFNPHSSKVKT